MSAFNALLGTISKDGVDVELGNGMNFMGASVARNAATGKIDIGTPERLSLDLDVGIIATGPAFTTVTFTSATVPELAGLAVGDVVYASTRLDFSGADAICLVSAAVRAADSLSLTFLKTDAGPLNVSVTTVDLLILRT